MPTQDLSTTARAMVAPGKGILAADESTGTITKRFGAIGVESDFEARRTYRTMLFTTEGVAESISGVILYDETIRQAAGDGTPLPQVIEQKGMIPGIKVDTGAKELAGHPGEKVTEGLDGLRERVGEYLELGARFAKWRAVITIGDGLPSRACLTANAHALARYAALCQEGGLVPIVEPEVLMDGDHSIEQCFEVTEATQRAVFEQLAEQGVALEGMVLKPNMVISGKGCSRQAGVEEVAAETIRCLRRTVPAAVPGIAFLSGGQSPELATEHLNAMNAMGPQPWELSFSYGRALQDPPLKAWKGADANLEAGQQAFALRARLNRAARTGTYTPGMETAGAGAG
ncbi:MAG: class I fructose-bisphosphate aldolase [Acidimicrobiales bacterium]